MSSSSLSKSELATISMLRLAGIIGSFGMFRFVEITMGPKRIVYIGKTAIAIPPDHHSL